MGSRHPSLISIGLKKIESLVCFPFLLIFPLSDCRSVQNDPFDDRGLVAVRDEGEGRNRLGDDEVRFLAHGDGTENVADAHGIGGVDGTCVERLFRSQTHPDASQGHHEAHVSAWA